MWAGSKGYFPGEASEYCQGPSLFLHLSLLPHPKSSKVWELDCNFSCFHVDKIKDDEMHTKNVEVQEVGDHMEDRGRM